MSESLRTRVMRSAARAAGGPRRLRDLLGASSSQVAAWLAGVKEPPPPIFLRAIELILDELDGKEKR